MLPMTAMMRARISGTPSPTPIGIAPRSSTTGSMETRKTIRQCRIIMMVELFCCFGCSLGGGVFLKGSASENSLDFLLSGFDSSFVWVHDGESLAWVAVGVGAAGSTVEVVGINGPLSHVI